MKKTFIMGAMLLAAAASFAADKVIDLSKPSAWLNDAQAGKEAGTLSIKKTVQIIAKELIPIDAKHSYNFSGFARVSAGKSAGMTFAGYLLYDKNKKLISQINAVSPKNSTTELVEAVKAGSSVLKIKANKQWKPFGHYYVGFNVKEGKLCRDLSNSALKSVKQDGNVMTVTLKAPLRKSYAAGTKVRIQQTGSYFYSRSFTVRNSPQNLYRPLKQKDFWVETAYARPMILCNWVLKKDTPQDKIETIYKDLKVTIKEIK